MRILGIDVGKTGGVAVYDSDGGFLKTFAFSFTSLKDTYEMVKDSVKKYKIEVIVTGKPNRMYNIIMAHMPYVGVINLAAEESGVQLVIANDSSMRAAVFGKGNGMKKYLTHEEFKGETPDVSDAMLMCYWLSKSQ